MWTYKLGGVLMPRPVSQIIGMHQRGRVVPHDISDTIKSMLKANVKTLKSGQFMLMEGDETNAVFCLLDGWLAVSKRLPEGDIQIIDIALPGEILEFGSARASVSAVNVEALNDARVAVIPEASWEKAMQTRPDLKRISRNVRSAAQVRMGERMLRLGQGAAAMRIAYGLLELSVRLEAIGEAQEGKFHIPMNQRMLGDFVGLSSVHVCRTLRQLKRKGILKVEGHMSIEILKTGVLREMAGVDLEALRSEILPCDEGRPSVLASLAWA